MRLFTPEQIHEFKESFTILFVCIVNSRAFIPSTSPGAGTVAKSAGCYGPSTATGELASPGSSSPGPDQKAGGRFCSSRRTGHAGEERRRPAGQAIRRG